MMLTDKCLAITTAILLIYGMVFAGNPSPSEDHSALMHSQTQGDMAHHAGVRSSASM